MIRWRCGCQHEGVLLENKTQKMLLENINGSETRVAANDHGSIDGAEFPMKFDRDGRDGELATFELYTAVIIGSR